MLTDSDVVHVNPAKRMKVSSTVVQQSQHAENLETDFEFLMQNQPKMETRRMVMWQWNQNIVVMCQFLPQRIIHRTT